MTAKTSQVRRIVRVVRVPADCFGNFGPNQRVGYAVLNDLGHKITSISTDDKEGQFLFQRLYRSAEIQRHLVAVA